MQFGAWIVGSAAEPDADISCVRDFDVAVPFGVWHLASSLIPDYADPNTFGGWKIKVCETDGADYTVDVWPDEMGRLVLNRVFGWAWHPKSGVRIKKDC